jgi:hypothetical protein
MEREFNEITNNLKTAMESVMILQNKLFNDMSEDCKAQILPIQKDIAEAMSCIKTGDVTKINEIAEKYARITNK